MIIRIEKRENPFAQIDKRCLSDSRLSWRARGILAYLLSKPENWTVSIVEIEKGGREGRDAVQAAFRELSLYGYATIEIGRGNGGKLTGKTWTIHEEPINGFSVNRRITDNLKNRLTDSPTVGKSVTNNNELSSNNDLRESRAHENEPEPIGLEAEKNTTSQVAPAPPQPAAGRRANTSDEAETLIRAWANGDGKETVLNWIAETTFSEKLHGRVRDEITKFVGHFAVSEKPGVSHKMFADPVLFFQKRFKAWLVQAKELNRPANNQRPVPQTATAANLRVYE